MTRLILTRDAWVCGHCRKRQQLPGVVPDIKTLKEAGWNFCPFCGEEIFYPSESRKIAALKYKLYHTPEGEMVDLGKGCSISKETLCGILDYIEG